MWRRGGFTLLEILIATGILTIGLASIVSLFPVAMNVGRQVIEMSNAVVIAQSVAEAVRDGIRNRKRYSETRQGGETNVYFVFQHDGVKDAVPSDVDRESPNHDYYVLLPRFRSGQKFGGAGARTQAVQTGKTFIYPETDKDRPNGRGDASVADDDSDDDGDDKVWTLRVEDVYRLGNHLLPVGNLGSEQFLESIAQDVLQQYSYAFAITPSWFDADLTNSRTSFTPANQLYHVRVFVFRAFPDKTKVETLAEWPAPVHELDFEVAI
jgi:prepilin-type N-terminal cleavage/methylation domain-containing protein